MGIEIQTASLHPGDWTTLTFSDAIQQWVAGISYFFLQMGDTDALVQNMQIAITNKGVSGNTIVLGVTAALSDSHRHTIDIGNSTINITCIAMTGSDDGNTTMVPVPSISIDGGEGQGDAPLKAAPNGLQCSFLSGFNFNNSDDERVGSISAQTSYGESGSTATVTAYAGMTNDKGVIQNTIKVDAGIIASTDTQPGITVLPLQAQVWSTFVKQVSEAPVDASKVALLLQGFQVAFEGRDRRLLWIRVGSLGVTTPDDPNYPSGSVMFYGLGSFMGYDEQSDGEDQTKSSVSALILVPQQSQ